MRISDWSSDVCSSDLRNIVINVTIELYHLRAVEERAGNIENMLRRAAIDHNVIFPDERIRNRLAHIVNDLTPLIPSKIDDIDLDVPIEREEGFKRRNDRNESRIAAMNG